MIVEGLLTTKSTAGKINVAPMGPIVRGDFEFLVLRPFKGSTTFENLKATRVAVFHIVDRINVIAEAAIRQLSELPELVPAVYVDGMRLADCCRSFELQVEDVDDSNDRTVMTSRVVHSQNHRPHMGFNRARHAVIEAAILATRVYLLPKQEIDDGLKFLAPAVEKTGEQEEKDAFKMIIEHINERLSGAARRG